MLSHPLDNRNAEWLFCPSREIPFFTGDVKKKHIWWLSLNSYEALQHICKDITRVPFWDIQIKCMTDLQVHKQICIFLAY